MNGLFFYLCKIGCKDTTFFAYMQIEGGKMQFLSKKFAYIKKKL